MSGYWCLESRRIFFERLYSSTTDTTLNKRYLDVPRDWSKLYVQFAFVFEVWDGSNWQWQSVPAKSKNIPSNFIHQYPDKSSRRIQKANVIMELNNFQLSTSRKSRFTLSARQKSMVMREMRMFSVLLSRLYFNTYFLIYVNVRLG